MRVQVIDYRYDQFNCVHNFTQNTCCFDQIQSKIAIYYPLSLYPQHNTTPPTIQ